MKTSIIQYRLARLLVAGLLLTATAAAQDEVPNGSFEVWNGDDPDFWSTSNTGAPQLNITPVTDAEDGELALRGEVFNNATPVIATTEDFPISQHYNYLVGYFKLQPNGEGDRLRITLDLFNDDPNQFSEAHGQLELSNATPTWTLFVVPVTGIVSGSNLVARIEIKLMNIPFPANGSTFQVDALRLTNTLPGDEPPEEPPPSEPTVHVISHELMDASGWYGGDDLTSRSPRSVGIAQEVLIDSTMRVESFSFFFDGPFDYASSSTKTGHAVTLVLNVRDDQGEILRTLSTDLPDTFVQGWVTWDDIDLNVGGGTELIFSSYLVGAYDVLQVTAGAAADSKNGYPHGTRYVKYGTSDADMELWTDWSPNEDWDYAFRLEGTVLTELPYGRTTLLASLPALPAARVNETLGSAAFFDYDAALNPSDNGTPLIPAWYFGGDEAGLRLLQIGTAEELLVLQLEEENGKVRLADPSGATAEFDADRLRVVGFYQMMPNEPKMVLLAEESDALLNPVLVSEVTGIVSSWTGGTLTQLISVVDSDADDYLEVIILDERTAMLEVWETEAR